MTGSHALLILLAVADSTGCMVRQDYLIRKQDLAALRMPSEESW